MSDANNKQLNEFSRQNWPSTVGDFQPTIGLVLGSGLGSFVEKIETIATVPFDQIEGLPKSKVAGHAGQFVLGRVAGVDVLVSQGRVHLYEGHTAKAVTAGVRAMASLGVEKLILTNAAGLVNVDFKPGEWMMLDDQLNLSGTTPLLGGANFFDMSEVYTKRLREIFAEKADSMGITLRRGVYASLLGPQYETPAEVRMLAKLGADAVGMSTALEAIMARSLGMQIAGFSCLTNYGAGLGQEVLDHQEVMDVGKQAAGQLVDLLSESIGLI